MGASLGDGLISAGVGIGVNLDSANDCERTAVRLRASAEDKRDNARRKRQLKNELESKRSTKSTLLRNYHMEIGIRSSFLSLYQYYESCIFKWNIIIEINKNI